MSRSHRNDNMPWERFSIGMVWMPDGVAPVGSKVKHGGGGHHKAVTETSQAKARECISAMDFPQRIFTLRVGDLRYAVLRTEYLGKESKKK